MTFAARKFGDKDAKDELDQLFEIEGIPTLVVVDAKTGALVTKDGRANIASDPNGEKFPWEKQPVSMMGPSVVDALNGTACLIGHCSEKQGVEAMTASALEYVAKAKKDGSWPGEMEVEFIVDDGSHALSARVSGLIKKQDSELLYILSLGDKKVFYSEDVKAADDITADNVAKLVAGFKNQTLKSRDLEL